MDAETIGQDVFTGTVTSWNYRGQNQDAIFGNSHVPDRSPLGCVLLMHGLKGYKDYGFLPVLADRLCDAGWVVHRFNMSCSGMTHRVDTFELADRVEHDTWSQQVADIVRVHDAVRAGDLPGGAFDRVALIGHSRGGVSSLLAAGRHGRDLDLRGVATINAPSACNRMSVGDQERLLREGSVEMPSARTGQVLRVGKAWLTEQQESPELHDVGEQGAAAAERSPILLLAGTEDQTVRIEDSRSLAAEIRAGAPGGMVELCEIEGGNHVLNVPNPATIAGEQAEPFEVAWGRLISWLGTR